MLCAGATHTPQRAEAPAEPAKQDSDVSRATLASGNEGGRYELTPERRALLNTIRYAEGTWKDGEDKGYRIMYGGVAKELRLASFEPRHQDQAALHLVERRGALGDIDRQGLTKDAMAKLAPEWASFPTKAGRSAYGQPVKSHQELASFYSSNLRQLRNQLGA